MTKSEHSPEPWADGMAYGYHECLVDAEGNQVDFDHPTHDDGHYCKDHCGRLRDEEKANRIRAAACVNALRGLNPEHVGELVPALEGLMEIAKIAMPDSYFASDSRVCKARELLAKVKG